MGAGPAPALGDGYVERVRGALTETAEVLNMGTSGDTIRDLSRRWSPDVLARRPNWLSVLIGINDVWRHFDGVDLSAAVGPEEFAATYERLVSGVLPQLEGLVLMTPFYVQPDRGDPMRRLADDYADIVRDLSRRHGATLVDLQAGMDRALLSCDYSRLAGDRVHPTLEGHAFIARAFLSAVGAADPGRGA